MNARSKNLMWIAVVGIAVLVQLSGLVIVGRLRHHDLRTDGGINLTYQVQTAYCRGVWTDAKLEDTRRIVERRVENVGASWYAVRAQPPDRIIVELPRLGNAALEQVQTMAELDFYLLPELGNESSGNESSGSPGSWEVREVGDYPNRPTLFDRATGQSVTPEELNKKIFNNPDRTPVITGADLEPACRTAIFGPANQVVIEFELNPKGALDFERVTRAHVGEHLAVFLDRQLLTAPYIRGPIPGGKGIIEGNFTLESAKRLADTLNAGALPAPLKLIEEHRVMPERR
jgi:preprotein translocase subunit SecD